MFAHLVDAKLRKHPGSGGNLLQGPLVNIMAVSSSRIETSSLRNTLLQRVLTNYLRRQYTL